MKKQEGIAMKNFLYIMTDHQRFDTLGMVQCGREVTPNLNQLIAKSAMFNQAYTTCPLCAPARTALATGIYPTKTNVVYNDWEGSTARENVLVHTRLKNLGYQIGHVGVNHIKVKPDIAEQGYDLFQTDEDYAKWAEEKGIDIERVPEEERLVRELIGGVYTNVNYSNHVPFRWSEGFDCFKDKRFCDQAVDFIKNCEEPFALFTYFWAPHPPLRVPEPYCSMYDPAQIVLPDNIGKIGNDEPELRRKGVPAQLAEDISIDEWRKTWAAYLGLVTMVDELIGKLIQELEDCDKAKDTVIIFTVDHGEHLGAHSMYQKMEMYEEAIHIPLIIYNPDMKSRVIDGVVSHLDIVPTMLDICKQPCDEFEGISLLPIIDGQEIEKDRHVFAQYSGIPCIGTIRRAAINKRYKYVYDENQGQELYDLLKDKSEMNNLARDENYKEIVESMHECCKSFHISQNDFFAWDK